MEEGAAEVGDLGAEGGERGIEISPVLATSCCSTAMRSNSSLSFLTRLFLVAVTMAASGSFSSSDSSESLSSLTSSRFMAGYRAATFSSSSESPSEALLSDPSVASEAGLGPGIEARGAAELVDGALDAALQAEALHTEADHGPVRLVRPLEVSFVGHR
jgi:hypothetical protein